MHKFLWIINVVACIWNAISYNGNCKFCPGLCTMLVWSGNDMAGLLWAAVMTLLFRKTLTISVWVHDTDASSETCCNVSLIVNIPCM